MPRKKQEPYWTDNSPGIRPHIDEISVQGTPSVRVMQAAPPFALGEVVAFFVGRDAKKNAAAYCKMMNADGRATIKIIKSPKRRSIAHLLTED